MPADVAYAEALRYTSNVVRVYSPNATWAKVKAAVVGASHRRLPGPWQRLAEPVHVRRQVHDQGRIRAQRHGRGGGLQQQVLRRAVRRDPRSRAERGRHPQSPVLRVGQLGAGQPGADASPSPGSAPTTTRRASSRPGPRRSSPMVTPAPKSTSEDCSRPTSRSRTCGGRCPVATATSSASRPSGRRARPSTRTRTRRPPASTARSPSRRHGVTTDDIVSGGYGDTSADPASLTVPRQRRGPGHGRGAVHRHRQHE